jgi:hypothetical protein
MTGPITQALPAQAVPRRAGQSAVRWPAIITFVVAVALALCPAARAGGRSHQYVTDTMTFGVNVTEASHNGFDLNNDGVPDNAIGQVLAGLSSVYDFNARIAASLKAGDVVMLHALRARSFKRDPAASWRVLYGVPTPNPVLTGGGSFAVDPAAPRSTRLSGAIRDGQFTGGPGAIPVRLSLVSNQAPARLDLVGARVQATCDANGCTGKLGGGIATSEVDGVLIPAIAAVLQTVVDASCPTSCSPAATNILNLFDVNHDQKVTADELRANFLIQAVFLTPDLDLLKANGRPGHDGVRESVSVGLGFTAKSARFEVGRDD